MGPLVAAGGLHVPSENVRALERELDRLCRETGFPDREEFKWSPSKRQWMYSKLKFERRETFFLSALEAAERSGTTAIVCINDKTARPAAAESETHEEDVVTVLLERIEHLLASRGTDAIILVDRPSGDRSAEVRYLAERLQRINSGTRYVAFKRLALVLASQSGLVRLLQLADLVVSCTLQHVAGESRYSPPIFEAIRRLLRRDYGRIGGAGLKLHPDFTYTNLYHWLCGDEDFVRFQTSVPLPLDRRPYATGPDKR